jgi:hypothetical protein
MCVDGIYYIHFGSYTRLLVLVQQQQIPVTYYVLMT